MASKVPNNGILLADNWKLVPLDDRNWELCEFRHHQDRQGRPKTDTEPCWHRCGRYYQYNTVDEAMLYVIDQLAKEGATDQMLALASALEQWREGVGRVREAASAWA
ncbi:MAG: hypothetical protein IJ781_13200 [Atopobiaceae bacterium]|nr:hypothetical protein [Atopobiaceae bacterium]